VVCGVRCYIVYYIIYYILYYTYTIILYYILYYYYTYTIIYYILYPLPLLFFLFLSSLLQFSSSLLSIFGSFPISPSSPLLPFQSPKFILYLSVLTYTYLYSSVHSSSPSSLPFCSPCSLLLFPIFLLLLLFPILFLFYSFPDNIPLPHSFYTCRYLHILIYILLQFYLPLHPNIHSILVGTWIHIFIFQTHPQQFDPARSIGVDG
jgi:hypothetical protein